ncbi:MAG TPA: C2H2-type zinc finger protein [Nitrososphaeraceae archaeon]|nr:C2H2-type zinc finger protein [Nitrososphaeraceae archaeon]
MHKGNEISSLQEGNVDYATRNVNADSDMLALFESLDGYIEYRDLYHVQKALEENNSEKKKTYQISDQTRKQPDVRKLDTTTTTAADNSIKDREAVDETEESKLHPEVSPTAMSNFICNICGKPFQNQNDLVQHQRFEGTTPS